MVWTAWIISWLQCDDVSFVQEKDLKQYMDDCGNIMSMTNVKVGAVSCWIALQLPWQTNLNLFLIVFQPVRLASLLTLLRLGLGQHGD